MATAKTQAGMFQLQTLNPYAQDYQTGIWQRVDSVAAGMSWPQAVTLLHSESNRFPDVLFRIMPLEA